MKPMSTADYANLGEHPAYQAAAEMLVNLVSQRQAAQKELKDLQRHATSGMAPPQALSTQIQKQKRAVASFDVAFAMLAGGMPFMLASGKSKRKRPSIAASAPSAK